MTSNNLHIPALDILIEFALNHQVLDNFEPLLEKITHHYDSFFGTTEYTEKKTQLISFYNNLDFSEDDSLFLEEEQVPYLIKTKQIDIQKSVEVFLVIINWDIKFKLPLEGLIFKLGEQMGVSANTLEDLKGFFYEAPSQKNSSSIIHLTPRSNLKEEDLLEGQWVDMNKPIELATDENLKIEGVNLSLSVLNIQEYNAFLVKCDDFDSGIKKNLIHYPDNFCFIKNGDQFCIEDDSPITFNNLKQFFTEREYGQKFVYLVKKASAKIKNNKLLHATSFIATPGQFIGVLGSEGAGKSSLLNLLTGTIRPFTGGVYLNSYNLSLYKYQLSNIIGYVPEEDLLFNELTCYENLENIVRLHYGMLSSRERQNKIEQMFTELNLQEIKHVKVGSLEDKLIRPGQRRLLNIALELIRDPEIMLIDNARSGLSLREASEIIDILSKFTFKSKLIITTITQTTTESFSNFDNILVINKNGYSVYYGQPNEIFNYFSEYVQYSIPAKADNLKDLNSEIIIDLVEEKLLTRGNNGNLQKVSDKELHKKHLEREEQKQSAYSPDNKIPGARTPLPRLETQYLAYTIRNFKTKLARKKELYYSLTIAPVIALLLALVLKHSPEESYSFYLNENIPDYFYLSIIINIFFGLSLSARELIVEKHIIKREERLNLSLFSYINSKVSYLFIILMVQSFLYTLIGNVILDINGMLLPHWGVYFSSAAAGSILGLFFSAAHRSYESILIKTIPTTLLILIILGGGWLSMDKIKIRDNNHTATISDFIINRWAYEAIMVKQFKSNMYNKYYFDSDREISIGAFNNFQLLPLLNNYTEFIEENIDSKPDTCSIMLDVIKNKIEFFQATEDIYPFEYLNELTAINLNDFIISELYEYLNYLKYHFENSYKEAITQKKRITDSLNNIFGENYLKYLSLQSKNKRISQLLRTSGDKPPISMVKKNLIQNTDIIYQKVANNFGRAPFFSCEKKFNNQLLPTYLFNLSIIWIINLLGYVLLITNIPVRIFLENKRFLHSS